MYQVQKRNGKVIDFDITKISDAIKMAFEAQEKNYHPSVIDFLALKVTAEFEPKIKEGLIAVEDIQDSVESVLVQLLCLAFVLAQTRDRSLFFEEYPLVNQCPQNS
ncbi:MAG: hypothetical protein IKC53_10155, partial [Lentisphaeria bacterium]|nr:hypothetical protein [Lentisphaeria bacterium]